MASRIALFLMLTVFVGSVRAEEEWACEKGKKPFECYSQLTAYGQFMCDAQVMLNRAELRAGKTRDLSRAGKCVKDAQEATKRIYPQVLSSLKAKPKAQELLKDHYAAWRAHLGLMPTVDPSPALPASSARLREKFQRLEVELE